MPSDKNPWMDPARIRQLLEIERAARRFLNGYEREEHMEEQLGARDLRKALDAYGVDLHDGGQR